ncbi:MAG TPA: hypothetical protein VHN99_06860 [Deinococcales bacterium]|nr:hypothetical protein [Deinococcales bacterium]
MTTGEILALVERHQGAFKDALHLSHWHLVLDFDERDPPKADRAAEVEIQPDYDKATIRFYTQTLAGANERQVLHALRHELLHVVLAPYDVMEDAARAALHGKKAALRAFDRTAFYAREQAVICLQRILGDIEDWTAGALAAFVADHPPEPEEPAPVEVT